MKRYVLIAVCVLFGMIGISQAQSTSAAAEPKLILVTGATGTQGGAVVRELLSRGYRVRGLTRNPVSDRAQVLKELGVEMVKGDFDDLGSLERAMKKAYAVFAVVNFWEHGYDKEIRHGKNIADAAKKNNIRHFIFSSVAHADEETGIAHFDSKYVIERYIHSLKLPFTTLRPVSFMDNWGYRRDQIMSGEFTGPVDGDIPYQQISAIDIARFAAEALDHPDKWLGRSVNIAAEQYSRNEIALIFSRVTGRTVKYRQIPWEEFEKHNRPDMVTMTRWFADVGYKVDIPELRKELPGMLTLEEFLRKKGWSKEQK